MSLSWIAMPYIKEMGLRKNVTTFLCLFA